MRKKIVTTPQLNEEILGKLISGSILAIRVPNFVSGKLCKKLSSYLIKHSGRERYGHEVYVGGKKKVLYYGVQRIGYPFNMTYGKSGTDHTKKKYYSEALSTVQEFRRVSAPLPSPTDKLRLCLDDAWKDGAKVARFENKMMLAGIGRVISSKDIQTNEPPHVDSIPQGTKLDGRFSGIAYLKVPEVGGELEVWDRFPKLSKKEKKNPEFNWRARLPKATTIRPARGELLIINTLMPHAVKSFSKGNRVAVQSFIGYKRGEPLQLWS